MKCRLFVTLAIVLFLSATHHAAAQGAIKITTCGTAAPPTGLSSLYMDAGGNLCTSEAISAGQGCTPYHLSGGTTASNNSTSIKGTPGSICHLAPINTSATLAYLKVYDSATAPTCTSATGLKHVYPIPANTSGAGFVLALPLGEAYANGIGFCVTGAGTDTDNSNAPTGVYIEGSYK